MNIKERTFRKAVHNARFNVILIIPLMITQINVMNFKC